ncbi:unnamed protein product [Phytomonas sp. Hart1]|nr:unnamed protein product [Phytomonas sp. Hart1]|eukprot:CCW68953.1 unnamed protein product [Phytomonas sp. isolate Hart1]
MRLARPSLAKSHDRFQRAAHANPSPLRLQLAASVYKSERRLIFKTYRTSHLQCFSSLVGAPLIAYGLYRTAVLCADPRMSVGASAFLWCKALALPDPTFSLPAICGGLTLLNLELSLRSAMRTRRMAVFIGAARLSCPIFIAIASTFPSGVCLYFFGVSLVGLLPSILLRASVFRRLLRFPS